MATEILTITRTDPRYPGRLVHIFKPPALLYAWGDVSAVGRMCLAVVGSRTPTPYGLEVTRQLVSKVAAAGVVIVSGLAHGIDTAAHEAALEAAGTTVAVVGSGLDAASLFPASNWGLAKRIVAGGGAVLSEYPALTRARNYHFPARNRIIAGLSELTLVVEAAEKSGALITARHAVEFGREVAAVPGPIYSLFSAGPNRLIREGAFAVLGADDLLSLLGIAMATPPASRQRPADLSDEEKQLLDALHDAHRTVDELTEISTLSTTVVSVALSRLELRGLAARSADGWRRVL